MLTLGAYQDLVNEYFYTWAWLFYMFTGIEPHGNMVRQPANFTVDTISAGQGEVMVFIEDPEGNREEVCILRNVE